MTDEQIIKAFEHLVKNADNHIPITGKMLLEDVLGVLNRKKAENEKLCKRLKGQKKALFEQQAYTAELQAEIERLQAMHKEMCVGMKVLKRKAIKEFVERLKSYFNDGKDVMYLQTIIHYGIDKIVKEMEGETK